MIKRIQSLIAGSPFLKNLITVVTGSALAQAIPLLVLPVLSRLYSKEAYGIYSFYMLVAYTASAFASLRFEFSIMLPKLDEEAAQLVTLCAGLAVALVLTGEVVLVGIHFYDPAQLERLQLSPWILALPLLVLAQSLNQTGYYWLLRRQQFGDISRNRVARSVVASLFAAAWGLSGDPSGLIIGAIVAQIIAVVTMWRKILSRDLSLFRGIAATQVLKAGKPHLRFPLYALPADLLSTYSQQLPLLFFPSKEAGAFAFVQNSVGVPLNFITSTVLDVFKERATRDYRETGRFDKIFRNLFLSLLGIGLIPAALLLFAGPQIFSFAFGATWRLAGEYSVVLSIMFLLKFVVSPLSYSYYVVGRVRENFALHIVVGALTAGAVGVGLFVLESPMVALILFSSAYSLVYVLYLVRSWRFASGSVHIESGDQIG